MSTFKAKNFRFTKSTQYADQLWLKTMGTIATAYTYGQSDSLRVAYLAEDSTAIPAVFGSMSWTAPLEAPTRCTINLLDGSDMVVGMTIEPYKTTVTDLTANGSVTLPNLPNSSTGTVVSYDPVTGMVGYTDNVGGGGGGGGGGDAEGDFTVGGNLFLPAIPADASEYVLRYDPDTGRVSYQFLSNTAGNEIGGGDSILSYLTVMETLNLPNLPTFRTPYSLYIEPMTGNVSKAEAPYIFALSEDNVESVVFTTNVSAPAVNAGTVGATEGIQLGSGSELWRLQPNPDSGLLAVQKLEGEHWVTKSLLGT